MTEFAAVKRGEGGFTLFFVVVKLDLERAIDQQTRGRDRAFEGFRAPGAYRFPRDSHAHIQLILG